MESIQIILLRLIFVICSIIVTVLFVPAIIEGIRGTISKKVNWKSLIILILSRMVLIIVVELVLWKMLFL